MKYKLDDLFTIESSSANEFILKYEEFKDEINPKTGKPIRSSDLWCYPSFKLALLGYLDKCALPAKVAIDILTKYHEVSKMIKSLKI